MPLPSSNYPGGFGAGGVTIRNLPVLNTYSGDVYWVDSNGGGGSRGTFGRPCLTINEAIALCTANKGDIIMVKAGHVEAIANATALACNKAGVAIIGMGRGAMRPTLTFGTAATANIPVSAANVTFDNILFVANFADIASVFTLTTGPEFAVNNCEFRDTSSILNFLTIVTTTVAVVADGLVFTNNRVSSLGTTAATTMVKIVGTHDRVAINDNLYVGAVLNNTAALLAHAALVVTNLEMARNKVFRLNTDTATGGILITTTSTTNTGMVYENYIKCADAAGIILVTAGCKYGMFQNLVSGEADTSGFVLPALDTNA